MIDHPNIINDYERKYIIGDEFLETETVYVIASTHLWGRIINMGANHRGTKVIGMATFEPHPDFEHFTDRVSVTHEEGIFFKLCPSCEKPRGLDEFVDYLCEGCR